MPKSIPAMVEPPLLVWARESFGYDLDQAAQKIGVSTERLASWEHGEEKPSISQLRKIASVYKLPIAVFYLPEPPRTFDAMRDFRRLPEDEREHFSPELLLEFRRARERREEALDLVKELGEEPKEFALRFQVTENPKTIAQKTREWLGVTREQQIAWKTPYEALNYWVSSLENLGVLVFQASKISVGQMRGFAISEAVLPVIVLNGQDTPRGRIFSLFHELTHLFLNQTGVSDAEERFAVQRDTREVPATRGYTEGPLSRDKAALLKKGGKAIPADAVTPEEEIKDPLVLEFLGLKDEYSESDLEDALIRHLESFLLELGGDFTFVGRQRRLRIDDEWYRVDLLFFHRRLRRLMVIDLKLGKFTHADAGQMHMYLNYAREHWTRPDENLPVGLILCAQKGASLAHYALEGLPNKVMAAEYKTALPDEKDLAAELDRIRARQERFTTMAPRKSRKK
jgi:predicted nuclease of restriction endonuclease-like (RecB) superfamily/transcriptional regulator with XRE-family HTH domain